MKYHCGSTVCDLHDVTSKCIMQGRNLAIRMTLWGHISVIQERLTQGKKVTLERPKGGKMRRQGKCSWKSMH
eukprot:750712-Pelagomonas_calceolata.AAC.4